MIREESLHTQYLNLIGRPAASYFRKAADSLKMQEINQNREKASGEGTRV